MAITTYSTLKSAITTYLGDTAQDANRDDFIDFAEAYFNRKLRNVEMEEQSTVTTDANGLATLPAGAVVIRSARFSGSPNVELRPISIGGQNRLSPYDTSVSPPYWYSLTTISSVRKLRVTPIVGSASIVLTYLTRLTPLSDSNTSNWLLDLAPDAYFYRALAEAYTWRQAADKALAFIGRADMALDEITSRDDLLRYANAELVLDGVNP